MLVVMVLVGLWIAPSPTPAQDDRCFAVVQNALTVTDAACEATGRNQACYGNVRLEAATRPGFEDIHFTQQGDLADVAAISTLELSSMNTDNDEWGVALMRIQANLPDTLPGQNVTFLLFGDVEIENAAPSNTEPVRFNITADSSMNIRSGPSTEDEIIGGLGAGEALVASGRLADDSWLQVDLPDGSMGWVSASLVTADGDISLLNVVEPSAVALQYRPMQAFYFRSGVGDAPCEAAPDSGILIQTPEGVGEITLVVNEVNIQLSSTVYLQAQAPGELTINGIEHQARVSAFGETQTAIAGTRVRVPLDGNRAASGPPSEPEPYDYPRLQTLPLGNLPRQVTLIPAQDNLLELTPTATPMPDDQLTYTDPAGDVITCDTQQSASDPEVDITSLTVGTNADGSLNVQVALEQPLVNDYSFAVMLVIATRESGRLWLWEVHDGVLRIGETNPATGQIISGSDQRVTIQHDQTAGVVRFDIPLTELPDTFDLIAARSFHTPTQETQPQPTSCDFAGPFDFLDLR
jgi:hypothetical protein